MHYQPGIESAVDSYSAPSQKSGSLAGSSMGKGPEDSGKDQIIQELRDTIEIMDLKIKKLEQLVRLKDSKIQSLTSKMGQPL